MTTLDTTFVSKNLPHRPDDAHKGSMGSLCCVTGSYGYAGAAVLCAKAALRTGVGLLYQVLPDSIYPIFTVSAPEAVCLPMKAGVHGELSYENADAVVERINACTAAVIGCGMQNTDGTKSLIPTIIENARVPLLIDADGLNALSSDMSVLKRAQVPIILTPHPKEFSRISGRPIEQILADPEQAAADFCERYPNTVLVLKGHHTLIARKGELLRNTAGNAGMAKGGSGDVLSGIIGSLMAQGVVPYTAAAIGVHIHALAGDIAAQRLSKTAMLPSDIIDSLPEVFKKLEALDLASR